MYIEYKKGATQIGKTMGIDGKAYRSIIDNKFIITRKRLQWIIMILC